MNMIPPEEQVERCREHLDSYRPKLEELFDVDLSEVTIKHVDDMAEDLYQIMLGVDPDNPRTPLEETMADTIKKIGRQNLDFYDCVVEGCIETGDGSYLHEIDTIYVGSLEPLFEDELAKTVVHELGHAIVNRLVPRDALPVENWLWYYVDEGFAEHLSIDGFIQDYGQCGMVLALDVRKLGHDFTVKSQMNLDSIFQMADPNYTEPVPDIQKFSPHSFGYVFFSYANSVGIPPLDVISNPPQEFLEVLHPELYIKRVMS